MRNGRVAIVPRGSFLGRADEHSGDEGALREEEEHKHRQDGHNDGEGQLRHRDVQADTATGLKEGVEAAPSACLCHRMSMSEPVGVVHAADARPAGGSDRIVGNSGEQTR